MLPMTNSGNNYSFPEEHRQWKSPLFFNGVCNGHSTIRKRIATLSVFSGSFSLPPNLSSSEEDEYYEEILSDLLAGKVREIPGYQNIHDFLSMPHLAPILRKGILHEFHRQAFHNPFQGLESIPIFRGFSRDGFNSTMEEIDKNIEISGTSQITFGRDNNSWSYS